MQPLNLRQRILKRNETLKRERAMYQDLYRELCDYIQPHRARFFLTDRQNQPRRPGKIINSRPLHAARVLASGMQAGLTSPSSPWFKLLLRDRDLMNYGPVKTWLYQVEEIMRLQFLKSNLYNCFYNIYMDLPTFGIAALHIERDWKDGLRGYNLPVGMFAVGLSPRMDVDTCYVEKNMTVEQMVRLFGYENCSEVTQRLWDKHEYDQWRQVLHAIEPNTERDFSKEDNLNMPFRSLWLELGVGDEAGFLRRSGYRNFPVLVPRWEAIGEDTYGSTCPGMAALGDCKALQLLERRKAQLVDKTALPPMVGPSSLLHKRVSLLPGDFNPIETTAPNQKIEPAMQVQPQALAEVKAMIHDHEERIGIMYFSDLWLMMTQTDRREITAREVVERHEEKMMQLGPVVLRMMGEMLGPCIDISYDILGEGGYFPEPPPELEGQELDVEFISILAQAQKLLNTASTERLAGFAGQVATVRPDVLDKLEWDEMVEHYADSLGAPPHLLASDEKVQQIRAQRAEQQERERRMNEAQAATQSVKNLSSVDPATIEEISTRMTGGLV